MHHFKSLIFVYTFVLYMVVAMPNKNMVVEESIIRMESNGKRDEVPNEVQQVRIDTSKSLHITSPDYLSITIDSGRIKINMEGFDFSSKKLLNLAAALTPINIRFGGTDADFLHFDPNGVESSRTLRKSSTPNKAKGKPYNPNSGSDTARARVSTKHTNFTMTGALWDKITRFCDKAGWDLVFDFDLFFWRNGYWDPSNADELLKYSAERGVRIPSFQLGNEPDLYGGFHVDIPPDVLVKDFQMLRRLISNYPQYDASALYGPDVGSGPSHASEKDYFYKFLSSGGCDAVTEVTFHHYYLSGAVAKVDDFVSAQRLDSLKQRLSAANDVTLEVCGYNKPVRLSETSSCYGGGAPNISDTFVAGFMWMDKLGLSAKYRLTHVFRQTFFGLNYALIDMNLNPNPDYYLTLLYKRLVEGPVFDLSVSGDTSSLRVYAHCVRRDYYEYPVGSVVVYFMNLGRDETTFALDQYENVDLDLFILTAGDSAGLLSRFVKLNGQTLLMNGDELPTLSPKQHRGDVTVPGHSFGFAVIPFANAQLCTVYHSTEV